MSKIWRQARHVEILLRGFELLQVMNTVKGLITKKSLTQVMSGRGFDNYKNLYALTYLQNTNLSEQNLPNQDKSSMLVKRQDCLNKRTLFINAI